MKFHNIAYHKEVIANAKAWRIVAIAVNLTPTIMAMFSYTIGSFWFFFWPIANVIIGAGMITFENWKIRQHKHMIELLTKHYEHNGNCKCDCHQKEENSPST